MSNEITLYGEIGIDVTAVDVKTQIAAMDREDPLVVRIDSPGGSVFQGFSIHESLAQYPGPKMAVVESAAFSIASYILTAFDEVEIASNGYVMIHNPSMMVDGDDEAFAKASADLKKIRESMVQGYAERLHQTPDAIETMMRAETYYNAEEAIASGFATRKTQATPSRVVTARQRNLPTAVFSSLASAEDAGGCSKTPEENLMADEKKRVVATVRDIKAIHPAAKADFIVRCVEKEMTAEEVQHEAMEEMQSENDKLKSQTTLLEEEIQNLKAAAEEHEAKAAEEEETAKAEKDDEEYAKAKARGNSPIAVASAGSSVSARQQWRDLVDKYAARGMDRTRAAQAANREHPHVRKAMLAEVNG